MPRFSLKEKRKHYTDVASGKKLVKLNSKFTPEEQQAYARGQRDALNESARIFKWKISSPEERAAYKEQKRKERAEYKKMRQKKTAGTGKLPAEW